jgi:hypothetical protein
MRETDPARGGSTRSMALPHAAFLQYFVCTPERTLMLQRAAYLPVLLWKQPMCGFSSNMVRRTA